MKEFFNNRFFKTFYFSILIGFFSYNLSAQNPQWINYSELTQFPLVGSILIDSNDVKWITTTDGLLKYDNLGWRRYDTTNSGLPENALGEMAIDTSGNLWITTENKGLVKYDGQNWTVYNTSNSQLPTNTFRGIAIDKMNNKWLTTVTKGILKFNSDTCITFDTSNSGVQSLSTNSIRIEDNVKWFAAGYRGVVKFNDTSWVRYYTGNSGLPDNWVIEIYIDKQKNKWFGTQFGYVAKFNSINNIWTVYNEVYPGLPGGFYTEIAVDNRNIKWFGSNSGLVKYNDTTVTVYGPPIPSNSLITALKLDRYNNLWIGIDGGIFVHNPNGVVGISNLGTIISTDYELFQNYPNPFNPITRIEYSLKKNAFVRIRVFDITGKQVALLVNGFKKQGNYNVSFSTFPELSSGIYFYSLEIDNMIINTKKMALVR